MFIPGITLLAFIYFIWHNDKLYKQTSNLHPNYPRWTPSQVKEAAEETDGTEASFLKAHDLPPKTGRRYIVVGGTGFLGSWIVTTLLRRGEDPKCIRIVDLRGPALPEQLEHAAAGVEYLETDITNRDATISSFTKAWTGSNNPNSLNGLTVFHCAATIRYFERHTTLLPRSAIVNMGGTRNVIEASKVAGADILLYTSSGAVGTRPARLLSYPWEFKRHKSCTQVIDDAGEVEGKGAVIWRHRGHRNFTSNYAETKFRAELLIRNADKTNDEKLRTGIIRPCGVLFGPTHQDPVLLGLLRRPSNPIWNGTTAQQLLYIEDCIVAHLLYEQRLLEAQRGGKELGGHAYLVAGPPSCVDDLTVALNVLSGGKTSFVNLSPTLMYIASHLIEGYELVYHHVPGLQRILPRIGGDLIKLQPASHQVMLADLFYDDSLIRSPVEKEGLGYQPKVSSLKGVCHTVKWLRKHALDTE